MTSSMEADVLDSGMGFEDESLESDLVENRMEFSDDDGMDGPDTPIGKNGEMIESYDKRELIEHEGDMDVDPYEGMEFDSEDAARAFYNAYASHTGFRVRVSRCHRSMRDGTIICRRFVCSREGFYMQKNQTMSRKQRTITRVGCMAMLVVKKQNTRKWVVSKFVKEHNHEPMAQRKVDLKPCVVMKVKKVENGIEEKESHAEKVLVATLPQGNSDAEPYEGMEFQSEEAARTFYYAYAKDMGFTVRISKCRRARDGSIICRRFVCSREGYYVRKYGRTKRSRALTRVGCLARLVVKKLDSGIWAVVNFEKEHNHPPFVIGKELSYQPPKPTRHMNRDSSASLPTPSRSLLNWTEIEAQNGASPVTLRFNKLHQEGIRFAEEGATSVEVFNVAMFALREATQKVVAAKSNAIIGPRLDNSVNNIIHEGFTTEVNWENNSGNQITSSNQHFSNDGRQAASPSGVVLIQQPVNLVLIDSCLPNDTGQAPLIINLPNSQALQGGPANQQIHITIPVAVQKQQYSSGQCLDGNVSVSSGISAGRKQNYKTIEEDVENFISVQDFSEGDSRHDGTAAQPQGWNIVGMDHVGSNTDSGGNSTNMALSEAQVAALQAVAEAFNVPTMGTTSSSALPIKVRPVSGELLEGSKGCSLLCGSPPCPSLEMSSPHQQQQQQPQETPNTPSGPNPLVHAAAIAAGARIAPPAVAASLIKAVQSRTAVRIRSGGPSMLARVPPVSGGGADTLAPPPPVGEHHQTSNIHYIPTENPMLVSSGGMALPGADQVPMPTEASGMLQSALTPVMDQTDMSNAKSGEEDQTTLMMMMMMYHHMDGVGPQTLAEQHA